MYHIYPILIWTALFSPSNHQLQKKKKKFYRERETAMHGLKYTAVNNKGMD